MLQKEKKTPDGVISIEEYLKKRKRINQKNGKTQRGTADTAKSSAFLLAELYM